MSVINFATFYNGIGCPWTTFFNQNSIYGLPILTYKTVASCQEYCLKVPQCVAIDWNGTQCWIHTSAADLTAENTYNELGVTQYILNKMCSTTATAGLYYITITIVSLWKPSLLYWNNFYCGFTCIFLISFIGL